MKLIRLKHKPSKQVTKWSEIKDDVIKLREFVKTDFKGNYKECWALAHCQVVEDAYSFFVVHPNNVGREDKMFKHDLIINPRIIFKSPDTKEEVEEACMSFPHRKPLKKFERYYVVTVEYQILMPVIHRLQSMKEEIFSIKAQIFQHECDHMDGNNIYGMK